MNNETDTLAIPSTLWKGHLVPHPHMVAGMIKCAATGKVGAFDKHWKLPAYHLIYRIDAVEEVFSFSPADIEDAVQQAAVLCVENVLTSPTLLRDASAMPLFMTYLSEMQRHFIGAVEYYVRRRHRLPITCRWGSKIDRKHVNRLRKTPCPSVGSLERAMWLLMIFSCLGKLLESKDNCVVVNDFIPTEQDVDSFEWNPTIPEKERVAKLADTFKFGTRVYSTQMYTPPS